MIPVLERIVQTLQQGFALPPEALPELRTPPDRKLGDLALPLFALAKRLKQPPAGIAQRAVELLRGLPGVTQVQAAGPYLNLFLDRAGFAAEVCSAILNDTFCQDARAAAGAQVVLEHTSINPNASPHVGRARNALIGDSLARMLRFTGWTVHVYYYVNDMGKQIALLVMGCRGQDNLNFEKLLDIYIAINARAEQDPSLEQEALALLRAFEDGEPAVREEFRRVTQLCLDGQRAILARLGITYDQFVWESQFAHDPFLTRVCDRLQERSVLFTDDHGRQVADLKPLGFTREEGRYVVLRRANGSSLYFLRDLAFNRYKAEQGARWDLIVLGEDHKLYFEQLSLILQAMSIQPPEPVYYSYVLLRAGKMSTRKGNLVLLTDFLDEATTLARQRVEQANPHLTGAEVEQLAGIIGGGAVKFSMLRVAPQNNVTFDWDQALTFEGDSGPYIQYSCARINSIFERGGREVTPPAQWHALEDAEWDLVLSLLPLPERLAGAITHRNPAILADFALGVARMFNRFYHNCPVLGAPAPASEARLWLCKATLRVLQQTLGLLGIEAPARM